MRHLSETAAAGPAEQLRSASPKGRVGHAEDQAALSADCQTTGDISRRAQSRMTRQRKIILEELRGVASHPTADEIYAMVRRRLPHISLGTVYRNLDLLAENRQILKLESAGSIRRFDGNSMPHAHVRCISCGRVGDVEGSCGFAPDWGNVTCEGFMIMSARVEYEGLCEHCRKQKKAQAV